jgi:hypothetical protein
MESETELNARILEITMEIQNKHSELLSFLNEMPNTLPNNNQDASKTERLKDYYDSLKNILEEYEKFTDQCIKMKSDRN